MVLMKSYFSAKVAPLGRFIFLFINLWPVKNAGLKDCSANVENSDLGVNVFGVFLYVVSPSLLLCFIWLHQNDNWLAFD